MSIDPLVSIIVNNYNYGRFLPDAIDSALNQTYPKTEVIVVDDGSTDESRDVIKRYGNSIIPLLKENGGQASAFNAGFEVTRGQIIIFLDSDDMLLQQAVERAVPLHDEPKVVKVHWPLIEADVHGKRTGRILPEEPLIEGEFLQSTIRDGPMWIGTPPTSGNSWARSFIDCVMPVPEWGDNHGADTYLVTLAHAHGTIKKIDEPLGVYRQHGENFTKSNLKFRFARDLRYYPYRCSILSDYLQRIGIKPDTERWQEPAEYWKHMLSLPKELAKHVPAEKAVIVFGQEQLGDDFFETHSTMPFLEKDGFYGGLPANDEIAIDEIERLREIGADFFVFISWSFWCVEYYSKMYKHLCENYRLVVENSHLIAFDLSHAPAEENRTTIRD